ncbi:glycosyltransferase [Salipiger manganoxidans]|uniref:glycosyltransferase n=1 Tax=Salipiger marinus TaxID=555512 RepID=UPI001E2F38CD|nr:glycosyltransferase [Salipiger manganoxidans]MCD1620898.1 glycosyltransferase [Salipiger manganoxidans]
MALSPPGSDVVHVFLAARMRADFTARYSAVNGIILPNAYMISPAPVREPRTGLITIGLLSNLSCAKGLDRFISLARNLHAANVPFRARLAGPVVEEDLTLLTKALAELPELDYAGPVYGDAKFTFLADLDLFVFPTKYHNEAQPIVIYEAMALGVPVLTVDRGCIAEMVDECFTALPDLATFDREAAQLVAALAGPRRATLEAAQTRARQRLAEDTQIALAALDILFGVRDEKNI